MMSVSVFYPQSSLDEMFARVWKSGSLTRGDRDRLHSILSGHAVSSEEKALIDRLLYATRRGWLKIAD